MVNRVTTRQFCWGLSCLLAWFSLSQFLPGLCCPGYAQEEANENLPARADQLSNAEFKAEVQSFLDETKGNAEDGSSPPTHRDSANPSSESRPKQDRSGETRETSFLRMHQVNGQPHSLDTAVVTYRSAANRSSTQKDGASESVTVDLIGAVHVGEAEYYAQLNELFDTYDVLLYELVAPEGTVVPLGGRRDEEGFNPIAMLQDGTKSMLGLESQLEKIDYTKPHFVRADMTPEQIVEKMNERGDTGLTLILDTLSDAMRQQNVASRQLENDPQLDLGAEISLADILGNPLKMKRLLAAQFAGTADLDMAVGKSLNQLLIVDRNAEALKVLQKQLAAGKKRIGIFYGAAHLADMEERLVADFGMEKTGERWLQAWDLTQAQPPQLSEPAGLLLNLLKVLE